MTDMRERARELAKLIVGRSCDLCPEDDVTVCDCTEAARAVLQAADRAAREECLLIADMTDHHVGRQIAAAIRASIRR